uniref:trehalose-phosphatase n=1 Tax=uncultured Sphingomonas sp. TaxID=158754 RepID=UPI0035CC6173
MIDALPKPPAALLRCASLFLDFDGTLVSLVARPDLVSVDAHLANLVARLDTYLEGRVALLSGRSVENISELFGDVGLAIAGSHGAEMRWRDGTKSFPERPAALDRIHATMTEFAHSKTGLLVETKPLGVALHYRGAPEMEMAAHALAGALSEETGLHLQTGKMMVELRLGGADKGSALRRLMERSPMAGHRPVFLGDDDTDEPAMAAAAALGGAGILVGAPRPTNAQYGLPDVAATISWLETACKQAA